MPKKYLLPAIIALFSFNFNAEEISVTPGDGTLSAAIDSALSGDILNLTGGAEYTHSSSSILGTINKPLTIQVESGAEEKAIIKFADFAPVGSRKYYIFKIMDGASLTMKGLDINGFIGAAPIAMSMVLFDGGSDPTQARIGTIRVDDCYFHDFEDNIFHGMKEASMKGIVQDSLIINNVIVHGADAFIQYKHPSLHYLELRNSTIYQLRSMAIKIGKERYRGYTKISPTGVIDHCTFNDMGGAHGHIQIDDAFEPVILTNSIISNIQDPTQPGVYMNNPQIDPSITITNTCFFNSGSPVSSSAPYWPTYIFQDTLLVDPGFQNADSGNFALPNGSPLLTFATDGDAIGDRRWGNYVLSTQSGESEYYPQKFSLQQNFPNPFNPSTTILYSLPKSDMVDLAIFDLSGKKVIQLVSNGQSAGKHSASWNGLNAEGRPVSPGLYFYRLSAGHILESRKMLLVK